MTAGPRTTADLRGLLADAPRLVPPRRPAPARDLGIVAYVAGLRRDALPGFPARAYEAPVVRRGLLGRASLTLNEPDAIRRVLVDNQGNYLRTAGTLRILRPILGDGLLISEGAAWRHQRRTLAPAFTPRAMDGLAPHIARALSGTLDHLDRAAPAGPVDLMGVLHRFALEAAGRSMFSVAMDRHGPELRRLVEGYGRRLGRPHLLDILFPPGWSTPLEPLRARFRRRWIPFLDTVIAARAAQGGGVPGGGVQGGGAHPGHDLLDLLISARNPETGAGFTPAELRDQVATMLLAGHETTAGLLFWALYCLTLAPGLQEAVAAEARAADLTDPAGCATDGRLPLTRAVIDETLRLYPSAFLIVRRAVAPDRLAGEPVRPGDIVLISPWVLHRHRGLWADPDRFDPGRFLPGAPPPPRMAYLPFGFGPRVCIGAQFALTEAVLALAGLVGRYRVARTDDGPILPEAVVTIQPDRAPPFRLSVRT